MKNEVQSMALPKNKRMLQLRLISLLLSILFTALTVAFSFGKQVLHWSWAGFLLISAACVILALVSGAESLFLNNKLSSSGL